MMDLLTELYGKDYVEKNYDTIHIDDPAEKEHQNLLKEGWRYSGVGYYIKKNIRPDLPKSNILTG